ncbi:Sphingolipid C4-hydroxylase sur2 [Neocucurbitaria cava]|uniref:Sphingolipid C4-hydroxylase sur2 n=1 Tax=Neocucurbitaria cava TaxID=798079 RepID=A0A9W9CNN5_9PLEO|nr:Sphingolipid C4-hydroxylase sur2 [Neocucurbitaria cava]
MASANTTSYDLPPLPEYTLTPLQPLTSWVSDALIQAALPVLGYWIVSLIFHAIDVYDVFPQYRLHTPAEVLKRNHVSRYEVLRDVVLQQIIQIIASFSLSLFDEPLTTGKADWDVSWYAQKIRLAQRAVPLILSAVGVNPVALASNMSSSYPTLSSVLLGGKYPALLQTATIAGEQTLVPAFAAWELATASFVYWYGIPAIQFSAAIVIMDAWEYMLHRAMHMNKWLYVTFHSRHHRLYVPYAYGALYNHPIEGFALDTLGAGLSYLLTGMTMRQSMWFFTVSTVKTVLDHGGYAFPYDPTHWIFPNNAAYHDIHHQSWGIKTNFSQPFFIYLDRWCGTMYKGDVTEKYERARRAAQQKMDQEKENGVTSVPAGSVAASAIPNDESLLPQGVATPRMSRKKASSISSSAGNFKDLTNKVNQNLHGRRANVLGVRSSE